MKTLYVDDEESKRDQVRLFLNESREDLSVETSSSVDDAMEKLKHKDYEAVVSDYKMSPKDGLDLLEEMRESGSDTPFIIITDKNDGDIAMEAMNMGADRYFIKEGEPEDYLEFLSKAIIKEIDHHREKRDRQLKETYFRDLFENSPEAIVLLDNEDVVLKANEAFEDMFGYDRYEIKGEKINDLIVPEDKKDEATSASKKSLSGEAISFESKRQKKDGTPIDVHVQGYPIEREEEQVGVFGIYMDISERKEREKKIKELYKVLGKFEKCSSKDEVFDLLMRSAREVLEFRSSSILFVEDDKFITERSIAKNLDEGEQFPIDSGIRGLTYKNQESYLIEDLDEWDQAVPTDPDFKSGISIPMGDHGVFQALSYEKGYFDEIDLELAEILLAHVERVIEGVESERKIKRSEEKYRTIFESANDAIFILKDYEFIECNKKTEKIFGREKKDILGKKPWDFSPEKQPDGTNSKKKAEEMIKRAKKGSSRSFDWVHEKRDGTLVYTEVSLNRYNIDEQDFVMAIVRDITERKIARKELEERNKKIKMLHKKASEFERCDTEDEICELIIEASENILDFDVCGVDFVEDGKFIPISVSSSIEDGFVEREIEEAGISRKAFQGQNSILVKDSRDIDYSKPVVEEYRSSITIPMGKIGLYQALSTEVGSFDEQDLELAEILINHATEAISRLRFENALVERNRTMERLHDTAIEMEKCSSEEEVFDVAIEAVKNVLEIYDYTLAILDEEGFVIKDSFRGEYEDGQTLPKNLGYLSKTYKNRTSYLIEDILEDDIAEPATEKYRSALSIPIGDIGVFQAMSTKKGYYRQEDLDMLETLFSHTYQVIQRIRNEEEIRRSKNRYRSIFENTGTATIIVDEDGTISLANKKAERLAGFFEKSLEGSHFLEFVVDEDKERIKRYHKERLKGSENVPDEYNFQLKNKKGKIRDVHVSLSRIPDTKRTVASFVDITDKKDMKKEKNRLKSIVRKTVDGLERIETYMELLSIEDMDDSDKENVEKIKDLIKDELETLKDVD